MVVWGHSGGGAECGILKCGTTMVVWERWMLEWSPLQRSRDHPGGGDPAASRIGGEKDEFL